MSGGREGRIVGAFAWVSERCRNGATISIGPHDATNPGFGYNAVFEGFEGRKVAYGTACLEALELLRENVEGRHE